MRSGLRGAGAGSFIVMTVLAAAQLGGSCVDGVTPDCSDAAECAPSEGDAAPDGSTPAPDGSTPPPEADADADATDDAEAGDAAEGG